MGVHTGPGPGHEKKKPLPTMKVMVGNGLFQIYPGLTLAGLETWLLLVDHVDFATATHDLGARLVLQRPKGIAYLHSGAPFSHAL